MRKIDYYRTVLSGIVIGVVLISGVYIFTTEDKPPTPESNFTVVDNYKGCDVIRWNHNQFAEYKYFLHCKNE
jgi:hypothetical protein